MIVGAPRDDDGGSATGSAYVFTRSVSTWSQQEKITDPDGAQNDWFGWSVSIFRETLVVGAVKDDDEGADSGSATVFTRIGSTWNRQAKLISSGASTSDQFGYSVSIDWDTVVVGANLQGAGSTFDMGSAYVFTRSNTDWFQQAKLRPSDAALSDNFGNSVAISGDTVVVGSYFDDDGGTNSGSVYVHRLAETGVRKLLVSDHLGNPLANGGTASPFQGQRIGTSRNYLFTVTNAGALGLDLQSISLGGTNSSEFSLGVPSISNNPDLAQAGVLTFTVSFNPIGTSGVRNATLVILSNDSAASLYTANISGLGLSNSQDGDNDGMSDWAEYSLRGFGFDWQATQENLVSDYYENASSAGLVTLSQVGGLKAGTTLLDVNLSTNRAKFVIELKQSNDLAAPFSPILANPARLSVDAQGRIVYEVDAPAGRRFYLMEVNP